MTTKPLTWSTKTRPPKYISDGAEFIFYDISYLEHVRYNDPMTPYV